MDPFHGLPVEVTDSTSVPRLVEAASCEPSIGLASAPSFGEVGCGTAAVVKRFVARAGIRHRVLIGQSPLCTALQRPDLRQLASRTAIHPIQGLGQPPYLAHRCKKVGVDYQRLFRATPSRSWSPIRPSTRRWIPPPSACAPSPAPTSWARRGWRRNSCTRS